ncbi:MAG: CRISPR-associated endonuclease Cas2 [Akkermansiaceae bacterium]|nr:CRISPR-associated endonuclease Cas2 [Akkermansiaceae bacterium]
MLRVIVYDIADDKRLRLVAKACEDFGVRVQKSVFECWLDDDRFEQLWERLLRIMKPAEDSLMAYVIDDRFARKRRTAGEGVTVTEKRSVYLF